MKTDYSFKLVAAIVFAGVIVALVSPTHASRASDDTATETTQVTNHAE